MKQRDMQRLATLEHRRAAELRDRLLRYIDATTRAWGTLSFVEWLTAHAIRARPTMTAETDEERALLVRIEEACEASGATAIRATIPLNDAGLKRAVDAVMQEVYTRLAADEELSPSEQQIIHSHPEYEALLQRLTDAELDTLRQIPSVSPEMVSAIHALAVHYGMLASSPMPQN